jgi:hypothetical protein
MIVHVILPVFRPVESWFSLQLRSILAQSEVPFRIWVCNDGPDDGGLTVARQMADPRVSILTFAKRVGIPANVERGLKAALAEASAGDLFAFSDQDDVWHPEKLRKGALALPETPVAASTHDARVIDADGLILAPSLKAYEKRHDHLDQLTLLIANSVSGMTILTTRSAIERSLPFPVEIPNLLHDWWLALVVSGVGAIKRIDESLIDYRQHGGNAVGAKPASGSKPAPIFGRRPLLGPGYRRIARDFFESRQQIALELGARKLLAPATSRFFVERGFALPLHLWDTNTRRYLFRCVIGRWLTA